MPLPSALTLCFPGSYVLSIWPAPSYTCLLPALHPVHFPCDFPRGFLSFVCLHPQTDSPTPQPLEPLSTAVSGHVLASGDISRQIPIKTLLQLLTILCFILNKPGSSEPSVLVLCHGTHFTNTNVHCHSQTPTQAHIYPTCHTMTRKVPIWSRAFSQTPHPTINLF